MNEKIKNIEVLDKNRFINFDRKGKQNLLGVLFMTYDKNKIIRFIDR